MICFYNPGQLYMCLPSTHKELSLQVGEVPCDCLWQTHIQLALQVGEMRCECLSTVPLCAGSFTCRSLSINHIRSCPGLFYIHVISLIKMYTCIGLFCLLCGAKGRSICILLSNCIDNERMSLDVQGQVSESYSGWATCWRSLKSHKCCA